MCLHMISPEVADLCRVCMTGKAVLRSSEARRGNLEDDVDWSLIKSTLFKSSTSGTTAIFSPRRYVYIIFILEWLPGGMNTSPVHRCRVYEI
jgi:hypothetical protein